MNDVALPDGTLLPSLGLGTWRMGEKAASRKAEVAAVRHAVELGYRLIDTAEMYGEGGAEEVVGQALAELQPEREGLFIVSKVYPHNASRAGVVTACERSLGRLGIDTLDLFLLHWPGKHPLEETVEGFEQLKRRGLVKNWGVSNFDAKLMARLWAVPHGDRCATNQVYYSLTQRGAEFALLPFMRERKVPLMAYSPIDQGALARVPELAELAGPLSLTPAQLALAWLGRDGDVISVPKAVSHAHQAENLAAARCRLDARTLAQLDRLFPPPARAEPLAML